MTKNTSLERTDKGSLREAKVNQQLVFVFAVVHARLTIVDDDVDARLSAFDKRARVVVHSLHARELIMQVDESTNTHDALI